MKCHSDPKFRVKQIGILYSFSVHGEFVELRRNKNKNGWQVGSGDFYRKIEKTFEGIIKMIIVQSKGINFFVSKVLR